MENKILAKVGTLTISEAEVNAMLMELGPRAQGYDNPQGREMILEQLIANKLLLLDAQKNPEKYPNLQVRLCGWNALFARLSKEQQDDYILRSEKE